MYRCFLAPVRENRAVGMPDNFGGVAPLCSCFFFSSRRRHTRCLIDWSSDVCSSDLEADEIAYPPEHRNIGDRVFVVHEPLPALKAAFHHTEQTLRFVHVAIARPLVLVVLAGEFMEEPDLAEHRSDKRHLEIDPLDGLPAPGGISRQKLAGFLREVLQDYAFWIMLLLRLPVIERGMIQWSCGAPDVVALRLLMGVKRT